MEDGLEEGEVDEGELGDEGDGDGEEEHFVRCTADEGDVETTSLECRDEIEEDEGGEGLRESERSASFVQLPGSQRTMV